MGPYGSGLDLLAWTTAIAVAVAAVGGVLLWWRTKAVPREVARVLHGAGCDVLRGLLIHDGIEGDLYLDCVLLTPRALFVLDLRDPRGAVFGAEKMDEWTVLDGVRRFTFRNPLVSLHDKVLALRHRVGDSVEVHGRIVFSPRSSFPKGLPPRVLMLRELQVEVERIGGARGEPILPALEFVWEDLKERASARVGA